MASTPYARVHALIGTPAHQIPVWQKTPSWARTDRTSSPTTLSGGPDALYSYAMKIAWRDGKDWLCVDTKVSATTNRHISAVQCALEQLQGWVNVGTETHNAGRFGEPCRCIRYQYQGGL